MFIQYLGLILIGLFLLISILGIMLFLDFLEEINDLLK